jgi:predicted dehydrogenase
MLAGTKLDMVDVTLPPALHADATITALKAGKHVFCEKPMALQLDQCERMSAAARTADRRLFGGHVLPFFPEYSWTLDAVRSGRYGALRGGSFRRVISDPAWLANFWNADQVGGPLFDLHVHDAHFIRLLFGMPDEVVSRGRMKNGLPEFWHSLFVYKNNDYLVEATSGTRPQQGRAFNHGFEIHLERATLLFEFAVIGGEGAYLCPPTLLDESGKAERVNLGGGDPMDSFEAELRNATDCVRKNQESDILSGALAEDAVKLCHMEADSIAAARQ